MYINVNNQEIYYQKLGQGKDLILLHGWKQDVSSFHNVAEELKKHFTLWLIDLPGFGRSENPKKPFTVSDYAETVKKFIEANKLDEPSLLGHSVGGRIGIVLAAGSPGLLDKLVLESSAGIRPKRDLVKFLMYPFAKVFKYLIPDFFGIKNKIRYKFYKSLESDYLTAGKLTETLSEILKEDLSGYLPKIKTPTLLVWGAKDPTKEASVINAKKMYRAIPFSRLEIIEDAGHFPHLDKPDKFLYFVIDFLT